ncbi:hypothetical protein C370_04550 [Cryptococcus neoformans A1-35-8]|nr:hypothetical protein C369_07360 [Cryptococcus neoformans var. grubii A5-35-17]OXH08806.1 hypothetical protein C370_04550 [Cryptococcus neoformans var. grubii A1-35-8]
MNQDSEERRID